MDRTSRIFAFTALGLSGLPPTTTTAHAEDDGGAGVGDAGFYGRLDVGDYPAPRVIYREPVVERGYTDAHDPVYVRVPTAHRKHWNRECRRYNACGEPVYFVRDDWYNDVYAPQYRERHDRGPDDRNDDRGNSRGGRSN
jgi:hypothetical protein